VSLWELDNHYWTSSVRNFSRHTSRPPASSLLFITLSNTRTFLPRPHSNPVLHNLLLLDQTYLDSPQPLLQSSLVRATTFATVPLPSSESPQDLLLLSPNLPRFTSSFAEVLRDSPQTFAPILPYSIDLILLYSPPPFDPQPLLRSPHPVVTMPRAAGKATQVQPITTTLKNVLKEYPPQTCLRELLQNADDAGATELVSLAASCLAVPY
jgi:hypothetical protein